MIIIVGLVILIAAVIVGVAGVFTNLGGAHGLTHEFSVLSYHLNGSSGKLFLFGMVVGAAALFGLSLLLTGARRTSRRGSTARRGLEKSRGETVVASKDRDEMVNQRDTARAETVNVLSTGSLAGDDVIDQRETTPAHADH